MWNAISSRRLATSVWGQSLSMRGAEIVENTSVEPGFHLTSGGTTTSPKIVVDLPICYKYGGTTNPTSCSHR